MEFCQVEMDLDAYYRRKDHMTTKADARPVEAMAKGLCSGTGAPKGPDCAYWSAHLQAATDALVALRSDGFDVYRPDDYPLLNVKPGSLLAGSVRSPGLHRLVPAPEILTTHKRVVPQFPRHIGPEPGHLSECLVVGEWEGYQSNPRGDWPPADDFPYCTCDDWSP